MLWITHAKSGKSCARSVDKLATSVPKQDKGRTAPIVCVDPDPVRCHSHTLTRGCINAEGSALRAHYLQSEAELDLGMKSHAHLVRAEGLDGLVDDEPTAVELYSQTGDSPRRLCQTL